MIRKPAEERFSNNTKAIKRLRQHLNRYLDVVKPYENL
jgi:hypothetical protein